MLRAAQRHVAFDRATPSSWAPKRPQTCKPAQLCACGGNFDRTRVARLSAEAVQNSYPRPRFDDEPWPRGSHRQRGRWARSGGSYR
jgi:hypothetical protein